MLTIAASAAALLTGALFLTVHLHEFGHAIAAFSLGCKDNWWETSATPLLYKSDAGAVDYACLGALGQWAVALTDVGGIAANLLAAVAALAALSLLGGRDSRLARGAIYAFALVNFIEAFSYLIVNAIVPRSDMVSILHFLGISRIVIAAASSAAALPIAALLIRGIVSEYGDLVGRRRLVIVLLVTVLIVGGVMVQGRMDLLAGATLDWRPEGGS